MEFHVLVSNSFSALDVCFSFCCLKACLLGPDPALGTSRLESVSHGGPAGWLGRLAADPTGSWLAARSGRMLGVRVEVTGWLARLAANSPGS